MKHQKRMCNVPATFSLALSISQGIGNNLSNQTENTFNLEKVKYRPDTLLKIDKILKINCKKINVYSKLTKKLQKKKHNFAIKVCNLKNPCEIVPEVHCYPCLLYYEEQYWKLSQFSSANCHCCLIEYFLP